MENLEIKKLDGLSMDVVAENKKKLMELFPEVFTEEGIILDKLKTVFGEYVEDKDDYYNFTWNGKDKALRLSQAQSTGTLRPCKDESKNWDTTQNLYIKGDNLEVLKLIQKAYHRSVKCIYIDPPYNTGKDFIYPDNFRDSVKNYQELTGQVDDSGRNISTNSELNGRFHTDWLNMIYPRLRLARNLLTEDGAIFISIDDVELSNLKKVCDEIFGEVNFISSMVWSAGRKNDSKFISNSHEYILVYAKNKTFLTENKIIWRQKKEGLENIYSKVAELKLKYGTDYDSATSELGRWYRSLEDDNPSKQHKHYRCIDERGVYFPADISWPGGGGPKYAVIHPVTGKECKTPSRGWVFASKERLEEEIKNNNIHFGIDENSVPCRKMYLSEKENQVPYSVFYKDNRASMKRLRDLFDGRDVFDYPKDEEILSDLISFLTEGNDIVMDFFSGSATLAQAVIESNLKDGGHRRFILVQLPELLNEKYEAYNYGYRNICDIGIERIFRVIKKYTLDNEGFKVFKLDSSNIKKWDANNQNLEDYLSYMVDNFVEGRTEEDVLYEIMLKYGIDLTAPIESRSIAGKNVYSIGFGALFVCLDMEITVDVVEGIVAYKDELEPARTSIIFRDNGFKDSTVKTNAMQILRTNDIEEVMSI